MTRIHKVKFRPEFTAVTAYVAKAQAGRRERES